MNEDEMLNELKQIRELLTPKPTPPAPPPAKGLWNEFKTFLETYRVLGLAVAFIMGLYLGELVKSLANDLLLPAIGLAIPGLDNLPDLKYGIPDIETGQVFGVGNFLAALITFIIVAFVIFILVKLTKKWGIE